MRAALIIVAIAMGVFLYTLNTVSNAYWEAVGPRMDRTLNPCKYEKCE